MSIRAKYEKGVFRPLDDVRLKEGTVAEMYIPPDKKKPGSVREFGFTGMWKGRRDIEDGPSYVNRLRESQGVIGWPI